MKKLKKNLNTIIVAPLIIFIVLLCIKYPTMISRYILFGMGFFFLAIGIMYIKDYIKKDKRTNFIGNLLAVILISGLFLFMAGVCIYMPFKDTINGIFGIENETIADGFTIEEYEVILDVKSDNKVDVSENILINFYEEGHHGIYKFTPSWLEYTGKDGITIKRKSNILNYRAEGEEYTKELKNGKEMIKIGNKNRTVKGLKTYRIRYTYDMGSDPFVNFDEFIFHAFGDYWGTRINNPKIVVHMPKNIDGSVINFFTDKYRKNNINDYINYEIDGNTITATLKDYSYFLKTALTIDIELPDNYFLEGSNTYGWLSFVISMIILGVTGYIIYMWSRYGKDNEKVVPTTEFYAPDNLNSAEIGYVYNNCKSNNKLTVSLIVQLASKGYIKIDEIKGKKKKDNKIQITNLNISKYSKNIVNNNNLIYETKNQFVVKRLDGSITLTDNEKKVYDSLFNDNSFIKIINSDNSEFFAVKDSLINKGYIEILKDEVTNVNENSIETNKSMDYSNKSTSKIDTMQEKVFKELFSSSNIVILSEHKTIYKVFNETDKALKEKFDNKVYDSESKNKRIATFTLAIILFILSMMSFFDIEDMNPSMNYIYYTAFLCVIVDFIFAFIMARKTTYGESLMARVKGFKDFLETVEKEKLEALVEQNPHYFYDILPYTYVLNISKKWIEKFQNIKMPDENIGDVDSLSSDAFFSSIASSVSFPSSSGSGGSSGGCSSCGGGCSSCGGGGSW